MGIDLSSPYIHSTTVLCDMHMHFNLRTKNTWQYAAVHVCGAGSVVADCVPAISSHIC